ncbi:MAG: PAS domain S-box protein, partial [Ginsengibacter sp.]
VIYEITTPNNERRIIEEKGYGKKDEQGKVIEIFGTAQDITAKMLVEEALRLSNENYNLISKATNDAIWEWDIQTGQITKSGDGFKILFGYENDFGIEKHHANHHLIHPEDFKDVLESQKIVFENPAENYWEKVFRFRKADGKYAYIHNRGYIVRDNSGKPIRMIAATQDVTVYKEQLNEIKNLQQNLQITINATDDLIWSIDKDLKIKTANKAFLEFTSYIFPEGNIQDIDFNSLNLEIKEKEKWEKIYARALTGEKFSFTDDVLNNQTKEWRHFVTTFSPIIDKNENISGVVCFAKDITELKNSALELQHSEKRFKDLFQLSPQPKWLFEKDTYKIVEVNKAAIDHYGYTEKEFLNMTLHDLGSKNNPDVTQQNINDKIKNKAEHNKVYKHRKKNGEIIYVRIYSTTLEFDEHSYLLITAIDITERRKQEHNINKAIIKAQENERFEIGSELHDNICQLLVSSKMRTSILKEHIPKEKMTIFEESQDYIVTALDEIRNLSHQLAPSFFSEITMEESIHKLFDSVNFSGKYRIHLDFCPQINEQDMSLDMKLNLYRILQEQFKNILKYANATVVHVDIHQHENLLTMSIADNGVGFDSKTVKSGIGISNMKRRAELCSGEFFLKTAPGKGTEITIILPIDNTMDS